MPYDLLITCKLGLESLVKKELKNLGYHELAVKDGEISFKGDAKAIARCNLWLRTAERVLLKLAVFPASTFDELFAGAEKVPWHEFIPVNGKMRVLDKCVLSQLMSGRTAQSIVKKAITTEMKKVYQKDWFPEDGPEFKIHADIIKDEVTLSLDTSGAGLHKRGYRAEAGIAPLRETIAAAMVMLSGWEPPVSLFDPFCGSGTIPIEAALIGANIAPGLRRHFDAEDWPFIEAKIWKEAREEAESKVRDTDFLIYGSDSDPRIIETAKQNAKKAGVERFVQFEKKSIAEFSLPQEEKTVIICNPPYGERMEDVQNAEKIYHEMGKVLLPFTKSSFFVLTPHPDFQRLFGAKAGKNRKIYNGKIKCYLYGYF